MVLLLVTLVIVWLSYSLGAPVPCRWCTVPWPGLSSGATDSWGRSDGEGWLGGGFVGWGTLGVTAVGFPLGKRTWKLKISAFSVGKAVVNGACSRIFYFHRKRSFILKQCYICLSNPRLPKETATREHIHVRANLCLVSQFLPHRQWDASQSTSTVSSWSCPRATTSRSKACIQLVKRILSRKPCACVLLLCRPAGVQGQEIRCQADGHEEAVGKEKVKVLSGKFFIIITHNNNWQTLYSHHFWQTPYNNFTRNVFFRAMADVHEYSFHSPVCRY